MKKKSPEDFIDACELSLERWLELLDKPPKNITFIDYEFPTPEHKSQYLDTIGQRSDEEVVSLLRKFLIPSCSLGSDELSLHAFVASQKDDPGMHERMARVEYYKRLVVWVASGGKGAPPWEGITWVLDLLPHFPRNALAALDSYILAHVQLLPDGRLRGLGEAAELIRAKYIGLPGSHSETIDFLSELDPRNFECLVERLYSKMGYETRLTPPRADGGRDVVASKSSPGLREQLRIECKRYRHPVGVGVVRALLGVVSDEKANKGVIVTPSSFTSAARDLARRNPRLELLPGRSLAPLLNEFLGATWPFQIERLVAESLKRQRNPYAKSQSKKVPQK